MCGAVSFQLRLTARLECIDSNSRTSSRLNEIKSATCSPSGWLSRKRCPLSISKLILPAGGNVTGTPGFSTAVALLMEKDSCGKRLSFGFRKERQNNQADGKDAGERD